MVEGEGVADEDVVPLEGGCPSALVHRRRTTSSSEFQRRILLAAVIELGHSKCRCGAGLGFVGDSLCSAPLEPAS